MKKENLKSKTIIYDIVKSKEISIFKKILLSILFATILLGFFISVYCTIFSINHQTKVLPAYLVLCIATVISFLFIIYYCFRGYRKSGKIFIVPILSVLITTGTFVFLNFSYPIYFCLYLVSGNFFLIAFLLNNNLKVTITLFLLSFFASLAISIHCTFLIPS